MISTKEMTKYRSVWMGIAILWVIFFHSDLPSVTGFIGMIKKAGYGGVDIFMFASGLGCYYSYSKCQDGAVFMKRRIKRVMPVYLAFIIPWFVYMAYVNRLTLSVIIGNLLFVQYFTGKGDEFNWYVAAMWLTYLITPLLFDIIKTIKSKWQIFALVILITLMSVPFWNADQYIILVTRIPLFVMGMYLGSLNDKEISKREFAVNVVAFVMGCGLLAYFYKNYEPKLWSYGLHWYPFILIVPGMCLLISGISGYLVRYKVGKWIIDALSFVGKYTFELFMMHMLLFKVVHEWVLRGYIVYSEKIWFFTIIAVIIGSIILYWLGKLVSLLFDRISFLN